jgi:hypothetical protein
VNGISIQEKNQQNDPDRQNEYSIGDIYRRFLFFQKQPDQKTDQLRSSYNKVKPQASHILKSVD